MSSLNYLPYSPYLLSEWLKAKFQVIGLMEMTLFIFISEKQIINRTLEYAVVKIK